MRQFHFIKGDFGWHMEFPEYIEHGGDRGDLAMVDGADTMLDILSAGIPAVTLRIEIEKFPEAIILEYLEPKGGPDGGAFYRMNKADGQELTKDAVFSFAS